VAPSFNKGFSTNYLRLNIDVVRIYVTILFSQKINTQNKKSETLNETKKNCCHVP